MRKGIGLLTAIIFLLGLGVVIGTVWQAQTPVVRSQPAPATAAASTGVVSSQTQLFRNIYTQVNPSVVSIQVQIPSQAVSTQPGQDTGQPYQLAAGSGFVFDTAGHIVTNAHVVQDATTIEVTFADGNTMEAKLTGIDLDSDLAVIQVQGDASHYVPVPVANSDAVQVGDQVAAIGNPFQEAGTMTSGIVSALHRTVQGLHTSTTGAYSIPDAIQTDAALNPGNSGGPLLNESGQVIGVNEQIEAPAGQSSGISFAIPSNLVLQVAPVLIQNGNIDDPYIGISSASLTLDINKLLKLPNTTHGALVTGVTAGGPAERAGIQPAAVTSKTQIADGDIITAVDKQPIRSSGDLIAYIFLKAKVGQTITLTVIRNGKSMDIPVTLTARPH